MLTFLDGDFTPLKQVLACLPLREQDIHRDVAGGKCDLLILDSSLLWQTVSNATDKSTATQTVRVSYVEAEQRWRQFGGLRDAGNFTPLKQVLACLPLR